MIRAEILVSGFVQGVGFRYFVAKNAAQLELNGYVKNLFTGEVLTVVEGEKFAVDELIEKIKIGPMGSRVKKCRVEILSVKNEFNNFEVRY